MNYIRLVLLVTLVLSSSDGASEKVPSEPAAAAASERDTESSSLVGNPPASVEKRSSVSHLDDVSSGDGEQAGAKRYAPVGAMTPVLGTRLEKAQSVRGLGSKRVALVHRMPLTYGKRGFTEGRDFLRTAEGTAESKRGMLDRMPLSYGKRELTASGIASSKRGMLDRMPLSYGKRGFTQLEGADSLKRGMLDRMPLSYGKRSRRSNSESLGMAHDMAVERLKRAIPDDFSWPHRTIGSGSSLGYLENVDESVRSKRGMLDRMPLSFGKRGFRVGEFANDKRGMLDRMPLSYGKRDFGDSQSTVSKRGMLDRMPLSYGKRAFRYFGVDTKRGMLDRMPLSYGKREFTEMASGSGAVGSKRGMLDRMPLSYGKRNFHQSIESPRKMAEYGISIKRGLIDRMPISYGKRTVNMDDKAEGFAGAIGYNVKRGLVDRMPLSFGKRSFRSDDESASNELDGDTDVKRALLHRMPLGYGKRNGILNPSSTDDTNTGMSINYENKQSNSDFGVASEEAKDVSPNKLSSPEEEDEEEEKPGSQTSVMNELPASRTYAPGFKVSTGFNMEPSAKRGLLDRMPISFGKRFQVSRLSQTGALQTDSSDRSDLDRFSSGGEDEIRRDSGDPESGYTGKRALLDRMPLSYGKRDDGDERDSSALDRVASSLGQRGHGLGGSRSGLSWALKRAAMLDRMPLSYGRR